MIYWKKFEIYSKAVENVTEGLHISDIFTKSQIFKIKIMLIEKPKLVCPGKKICTVFFIVKMSPGVNLIKLLAPKNTPNSVNLTELGA